METYKDFLGRISYQQPELLLEEGDFKPDKRVYEKVDPDNSFKPFFGDTVVFELDSSTKEMISKRIKKLYDTVPACFSEQINTDTLHMTLHDLSASDKLEKVSAAMFKNEVELLRLVKVKPQQPKTIKMKSNYIINMVNTSLVLALVPENETEWIKLQALYDLINEVRVCPYPFLTPHITLAYFNYNGFDQKSADKLRALVFELNKKSLPVTLDTNKLYYQKFTSMNEYFSVFGIV